MELAILTDELSLDLNKALEAGAELGFRKYEVRCIDSYEHRIPYFREGRENALLDARKQRGVAYTAVTPGIFKIKHTDSAALKKEMEETLPLSCEMAKRLGAPRLIVFGFLRGPEESETQATKLLAEAAQVAKEFDLEFSIENEPGAFCDTAANTAAIVETIAQPHVGINWDPANAVISGEIAYPTGYYKIKPYLQNVHIKDSIPLPDGQWENHLIGEGGVNWVGQIAALLRDRPVSHLTLETHVFPVLEATKEDLRRLRYLFETAEAINSESLYPKP